MSKNQPNPYLLLGLLAIIWGSSFILIKEGLKFYSKIKTKWNRFFELQIYKFVVAFKS